MEEKHLKQLTSRNPNEIKSILNEFNKKNAELFNFTKFHIDELWYKIWRAVFDILNDGELSSLHPICLNTIRILTRDEQSLQKHNIATDLGCLLDLAQLSATTPTFTSRTKTNTAVTVAVAGAAVDETNDVGAEAAATTTAAAALNCFNGDHLSDTIAEALKCLCNLVFQNLECRRQCIINNVIDVILRRVASSIQQHPCAVELYDMKLLFLITALEPAARSRVQIDLNGITYMTEWLDEKLSEKEYSNEQLDLIIEMLKVLFNITTSPDKSPNENEIQSLHLTVVIREILLRFGGMEKERQRNIIMHAINLLTNIASSCLTELIIKTDTACTDKQSTKTSNIKPIIFEGYNVRVIDTLLRYLRIALDEQENAAASYDAILPVLTVLVKCVRCNRIMRHYIRNKILPPLRDVSQRPEVGNELRNYLCRFLTLPQMMIRDLSAELLFVCCKENVSRMIKYTGYGNAAGLFAKRGILDCRNIENPEYSSDSEDSDTEEYKQLQDNVNPVSGSYEMPKINPLDGMSEEQKEHEAMQLVNLIDKLHRTGIMQPCRIGEDGKPEPVDHILQLQEDLPQQQMQQKRKT